MDSTTERRFTRTEVRLDEPHFDEEATLLSAQPVVPLEEVKAKTRSKARLALALAIGGGLLIGLLAATLIYSYIGSSQPQVLETAATTEQPAAALENSAGGAIGRVETPVTADDVTPQPVVTEEPPVEPAPVKTDPATAKPKIQQSTPKTRPVIIVRDEPELEDDDDMDREARRAARQAKRQRRVTKEARRERAQTTDDLLRIREIFEGSPRP
jgi:hypothetical protein